MNETASAPSPTLSRNQASLLLGRTMGLVGFTAGSFAAGAHLARELAPPWGWVLFGGALLCVFALNVAVERSGGTAVAVLLTFGGLLGAAVSPTIVHYAGADPEALTLAATATGLFVVGFGAAGYATNRDLSGWARGLLWALVGLILFGVVLAFVRIPGGGTVYAIVGLVIFAGLTTLDFQRLRRSTELRTAPLLAASIILDGLNVFILFLDLFRAGEK